MMHWVKILKFMHFQWFDSFLFNGFSSPVDLLEIESFFIL